MPTYYDFMDMFDDEEMNKRIEEILRKQVAEFARRASTFSTEREPNKRKYERMHKPDTNNPKPGDIRWEDDLMYVYRADGTWERLQQGQFTFDPEHFAHESQKVYTVDGHNMEFNGKQYTWDGRTWKPNTEPLPTLEGQDSAEIGLYCIIAWYQNQFYLFCGDSWENGWGLSKRIASKSANIIPVLFGASDCEVFIEYFSDRGIHDITWVPVALIFGKDAVPALIRSALEYAKTHGFNTEEGEFMNMKTGRAGVRKVSKRDK